MCVGREQLECKNSCYITLPFYTDVPSNQLQLCTDSKLNLALAIKRVRPLLCTFNWKWHPHSQKKVFLDTFSLTAWDHLPAEEKDKHSLKQCLACHTYHLSLTLSFPDKKDRSLLQHQAPTISFNEQDLSSASNLGKKALKELNVICEHQFKKSVQVVLSETPKSKLIKKPSRLSEKRKTVRETKKAIQQAMDDSSTSTVMGNRLSWRKFDTIRRSQALDNSAGPSTPSRKRKLPQSGENLPESKRKKHGSLSLPFATKENLLAEARTWTDDETVNWSRLAREHGIANPNGGQTVKEFLRAHNIPAASKMQNRGRAHEKYCLEESHFQCIATQLFIKKNYNQLT